MLQSTTKALPWLAIDLFSKRCEIATKHTEDAPKQTSNEVGVELVPVQDTEWESMVPIDFAKYLSDKWELTAQQRGPVPLLA